MAVSTTASAHAARVRRLARLLDTAVRVPGTDVRFGLDAALGLVPGVGDLAGAALSGYIVLAAVRLGAPAPVLVRMLLNVGVDTVTGSVPLLGDLFDVGWRANVRNADLLERHLASPAASRAASRWVIGGVVVGLALLAVAAVALTTMAVRAVGHLLG